MSTTEDTRPFIALCRQLDTTAALAQAGVAGFASGSVTQRVERFYSLMPLFLF